MRPDLLRPLLGTLGLLIGFTLYALAGKLAEPWQSVAIGGMLASQVGSGLGTLAQEVLSVSDVGVPLAPAGRAALVPIRSAWTKLGTVVSAISP